MFVKTPQTSRVPVKTSQTVSIAAGGSGSATVTIPEDNLYFIKTVNVTKGTNVTVSGIRFDGVESGQTATFDCVNVFGDRLTATKTITITGSNAGAAAENLTIEVIGTRI